jgi:hypothetical protein
MKISMDGVVKRAKEIGSGNGIEITLPELSDSKFNIYAIELAIFEKQQDSNIWHIYTDKRGIESKRMIISEPTTLKIQIDFGEMTHYRIGSKYKIGYRYHVQSIDDMSVIAIAGQDIKDGWRLAGENNSAAATEQGFSFYPNTTPEIIINSIQFQAEEISGSTSFEYSVEAIESVWLPKNVFESGIKLNYTATDKDTEDSLTVSYKLINPNDNSIISQGNYNTGEKVTTDTQCEYVNLIVTVMDNWGASNETQPILLKVDRNSPEVVKEFDDKGKMLRGKNLYSKFTINDGPNELLSQGLVYYSIIHNGKTLYNNIAFSNNTNGIYTLDLTNMEDGEYDIILTIFDKGHNKSIHTLKQKLDSTPPSVAFLTPQQNEEATLYSTWMNTSKKVIISATDSGAGIWNCSRYLNNAWQGSISFGSIPNAYTFVYDVATDKTGKLFYSYYFYDNAYTIDKTSNTVSTSPSGNCTFVSRYVWLDKTPPTISIDADENSWYEAPVTIKISAYDYPSASGIADNSGVKTTKYCITEGEEPGNIWIPYSSSGVTFDSGGVYYLHVESEDFAGNKTIETKKIRINSNAILLSGVSPTDDYAYTIYNRTNYNGRGIYVVKNTAYNTKYRFSLQDNDINDTILTNVRLVNMDDDSIYSETWVETAPTGNAVRDIIFNISYISEDGSALPDGTYAMHLTISEVKNSDESITTYSNIVGCEVVIKRTSPPVPQISVSDVSRGKMVTINYPNEALAGSLNRSYISALCKREYKIVEDGSVESNIYNRYMAPIHPITKECVITALYTDCAGNVSTSSMRIFTDNKDESRSIQTEGDTAAVEEGRSTTTYYIGIRRDKQIGIDSSHFNFMK